MSATTMRDYGAALELVREASEAVRASEGRVEELEQELERVTWTAGEQARELNARIEQSNNRSVQLEEQLRLAENRAQVAEAWLQRLHEAVVSSFGPIVNSASNRQRD